MNNKESYKLVHKIILEKQQEKISSGFNMDEYEYEDIKRDPKFISAKHKAAELSAQAELERAENQLKKAQLDKEKIETERQKFDKDQEEIRQMEMDRIQNQVQTVHRNPADSDLNSGDPINKKKLNGTIESVNEGPEDEQYQDPNESDMENLPPDAESNLEVEIAGETPQDEDAAKISQIQAKTREIQAKIGEYTPPGGGIEQDAGDIDPSMANNVGDPSMGGGEIDPMTGMPVQEPTPPDPMKGFGDTTDPAAQDPMMGGMGGIDPMTGMQLEDESASKTPSALGRLYMMKKIYVRLSLLDKILTDCPDEEIIEIRDDVREAFEMFKLIVNNLKSFKEKADELIIDYYILVRDITKKLEAHFKYQKMLSEDQI